MNRIQSKKTRSWTRARVKNGVIDVTFYLLLLLISMTCLLPFVHIFAKSISKEAYVIANRVFLIPKDINFHAYEKVFQDASIVRSLYVSVIVTLAFTAIGTFLTISAAYALSRTQLKGRKVMTFLIMFTMYFTAGTIPDYLLMNDLHMLDTWWCMILPLSFAAYNFLIMKNNFKVSIPDSLIESALMDGASHFKILSKIVVPLTKPIIATISLFYAVGRWNAYSDALFYIKQRVDLRPLQLKLYYLIVAASESFKAEGGGATGQITNPEVLKASCIIFATLPIICIYPFVQRYFVQGVMIGAVKG